MDCPPSARALLDTISVFHDFATFNTLTMIHEQDSVELLSDLEELEGTRPDSGEERERKTAHHLCAQQDAALHL